MRTKRFSLSVLRRVVLVFCLCLWGTVAFAAESGQQERRFVSLAPSATEWIVALGLEGRLQGITEQCDFPLHIRNKEKVGSYMRASLERILALRATDVVAADALPEILRRRLEAAGVRVHVFAPQRFDDFPMRIRELGVALGVPQAAESWSKKFRAATQLASQEVLKSKVKSRRSLMFVSVEPVYLVGHSQWLSDLFQLAGFENAFADERTKDAFPRVSFEALAQLDAQIWFGFSESEPLKASQRNKLLMLSQRFSRRSQPDIRIVSADVFQRPGPRLLEALVQLRSLGL